MKIVAHDRNDDTNPCTGLYKAGGAAALIAAILFRRNMDAEWMLLRSSGLIPTGPADWPGTVAGWFALLQQNPLIGLTLLNLFDLVNYALVGILFLALITALWRASRSWMVIAAALTFAGVTTYFATNQVFTMLSLSREYASAAGAQRGLLLAAGQAALAIHRNATYSGGGMYLSFLFVTAAGLIIAAVMLRSHIFGKAAAYTGILANICGLGYYVTLAFAPAVTFLPLSISAVFLLVWYILTGVRLWSRSSLL